MEKIGRKIGWVLLWGITVLEAFTMGSAGLFKFSKPFWERSFLEWGYPGWFVFVIGALEVIGAFGVLIPRVAHYAASGLILIMGGALYTVIANESSLGWGTPLAHLAVLAIIAVVRGGLLLGNPKRGADST